MQQKVSKSAHVWGRKSVYGDWLVTTFARQNAESGGAVMKWHENVATWVNIERTAVIILEIISEQSARSVRCKPFPNLWQKVIHTRIHMGKPQTGIAGGKLWHRRVYRFHVPDGGKVSFQKFDRRDSTFGVAS